MRPTNPKRLLAAAAAAVALLATPAAATEGEFAPGETLPNPELRTADGTRATLLGPVYKTPASLFLFVRPGQPQSARALEVAAALQAQFGRRARFAAVVSAGDDVAAARAMVRAAGARMPVLVDDGDVMAAHLGVRSYPLAAIADIEHRLASWEYFSNVNWAETLQAQVAAVVANASLARPPRLAIAR